MAKLCSSLAILVLLCMSSLALGARNLMMSTTNEVEITNPNGGPVGPALGDKKNFISYGGVGGAAGIVGPLGGVGTIGGIGGAAGVVPIGVFPAVGGIIGAGAGVGAGVGSGILP